MLVRVNEGDDTRPVDMVTVTPPSAQTAKDKHLPCCSLGTAGTWTCHIGTVMMSDMHICDWQLVMTSWRQSILL